MPAFGIGPASGSPSSSVGVGIGLPEYRSDLADQLGLYDGTLSVAALASGPDANRYVIVDGLRDDEAARDQWAGGYIYAHNGTPNGLQLKILSTGTHGRYGALAVANPPDSPLAAGTALELSWPLPIKRYAGIKGIDDLVTEGLARTRVLARISFDGDGSQSHSLTDYPFIVSEDDIRGLYDTTVYGPAFAMQPASYGFRVDGDGSTRTLVTDYRYPGGSTFEAEVVVAGDRLVYDGAGWLYPTTPGLLDDTYQAAAPVRWVTAFGMGKGLQQLRKLVMADRAMDRAERALRLADLDQQIRHWAGVAHRFSLTEMSQPIVRPRTSPMVPNVFGGGIPPWTL